MQENASKLLNIPFLFKNQHYNIYTPQKTPTMSITTPFPHLLLLFLLTISTTSFKNFGMNKPHYLFHLGQRRPVSTNIGWGYWSDSSPGTPMRLKYANTNDGLYAHMTVHDGETFFQQEIEDRNESVKSVVKYQISGSGWESQIEMENGGTGVVTWFCYFSVENNDYKLVDHEKLISYIHLSPEYVDRINNNHVKVNAKSLVYPNQTITVTQTKDTGAKDDDESYVDKQEKNQMKIFGLNANISETFTINHISDTFKRLVRVHRGEEKIDQQEIQKNRGKKEKSQKAKILQWEKRQVELIKDDQWQGKNYVVLYLYGELKPGQKTRIYLTNSTTPASAPSFDHKLFQKRSASLTQLYSSNIDPQSPHHIPFITHTLSNLYAGLTFYYGRLYTQNSLTVHKQDYSYSFTPSRLIFPRSFLWDDGFHQSVIVHYNTEIVLDVLTNWMNKIDIFGWIGREQIRGGEISGMMPDSRFVFQDWFEMNPPTLMLSIITLIDKSKTDPILEQRFNHFLTNYYRKLQMWYRYFKNTQSHQSLEYEDTMNVTDRFFRWHCKDQCSKGNFMGSGLDDYPRRGDQGEIAKQHVDLVSWLYFFSSSLVQIGKHLEKTVENSQQLLTQLKNTSSSERIRNKYSRRVKYYKKQSLSYIHQLYSSFYDPSDHLFKDVVVTKGDLFIQKFVDKVGYINLFPFFTGMLKEEKGGDGEMRVRALRRCLEIMGDEKLLLSEDGLRSLSLSDPLYGTDDNYWRGAVWLPINYMVLRACKLYYWNDPKLGPEIHKLYSQLRTRLINSVYNTYKDTGYLYENYYEGRGHRGFPFYGWTSTIVNIITEQY